MLFHLSFLPKDCDLQVEYRKYLIPRTVYTDLVIYEVSTNSLSLFSDWGRSKISFLWAIVTLVTFVILVGETFTQQINVPANIN